MLNLCLNVELKEGLANYFAPSLPTIAELIHSSLATKGISINTLLLCTCFSLTSTFLFPAIKCCERENPWKDQMIINSSTNYQDRKVKQIHYLIACFWGGKWTDIDYQITHLTALLWFIFTALWSQTKRDWNNLTVTLGVKMAKLWLQSHINGGKI